MSKTFFCAQTIIHIEVLCYKAEPEGISGIFPRCKLWLSLLDNFLWGGMREGTHSGVQASKAPPVAALPTLNKYIGWGHTLSRRPSLNLGFYLIKKQHL